MQPFALLLGSQNIIAVSTSLIVFLLFVIFQFHIKIYVVIAVILTSLLFLSNYFLFDNREIILPLFIEFLLKCFSLFIIASFPFVSNEIKKYFAIFSLLNFIVLAAILVFGWIDNIEYMRFGYAMLPTTLVSIYAFRQHYKILNGLVGLSSFILIIIYGSRGPILGVLIFLLIILISDKKLKIPQKILSLSVLIIGYFYMFVYNGFIRILDFTYYDLNLQTYSIHKLRVMINEGFAESSSGRDFLYEQFIEQIMREPILGSGIGITHTLWDITSHNLFLQIFLEFGVMGMLFFLLLALTMIFLLLMIRKTDNELFLLLTIVFAVSFGRLLVSSDMWVRQELWLFTSLTINAFLMIQVSVKKQEG